MPAATDSTIIYTPQSQSENSSPGRTAPWTAPPVTPHTLMLVLAYVQRAAPRHFADSRFTAAGHLRALARWIGRPAPRLRSLRHHPLLAAHIALLLASGLLTPTLSLGVYARTWLHETHDGQIARLLKGLRSEAWDALQEQLKLARVLTADYTAYLEQTLQRQLGRPPCPEPPWLIRCQPATEERWVFTVVPTTPLPLYFHLLQLGEWTPPHTLTCTSLSIGQALEQGYNTRRIRYLLETAGGQPLTPQEVHTLRCWSRRNQAYRVDQVYLLSTRQDEQLAGVLQQQRLRRHVLQQIGPRHALVSTGFLTPLQRWLAGQGIRLNTTLPLSPEPAPTGDADPAVLWLALKVLQQLETLVPLPVPTPRSTLQQIGQQLSSGQRAELDLLAAEILQRLETAISGRDAFFPAYQSPDPQLLDTIQQAIRHEEQLYLTYQSLGEHVPSGRRIQPWRLTRRGQLYYLHAYCYRAERELTFRLDRVVACDTLTQ